MIVYMEKRRSGLVYRALSAFIAVSFIFCSVIPGPGFAQSIAMLNLPLPGAMVTISLPFVPVLLKGMTINPDDPLKFNFIVDSGNTDFDKAQVEEESQKLIKYFLASMTVPKDDLWVNLSPYENDRIIPEELGRTELGRDLLAQDYILKQLTASLMYPEDELGKEFWKRIYEKAQAQYGTTDIPVDTFNKVWILPEQATVYENGNTVYVVNSKMKVMLDSDYQAMMQKTNSVGASLADAHDKNAIDISEQAQGQSLQKYSEIVREIILPEIEKEVNEGKNFAPLRQIYHSLILAKWYKETIKNSLLSEVYVDQNKTAGVELDDKAFKEEIYEQYMQAYKKGVFDFIREDYDELSQEVIPRKYFSGGFKDTSILTEKTSNKDAIRMSVVGNTFDVELGIKPQKNGEDVAVPPAVDTSMLSKDFLEKFDAIKASGTYSASVEINNHQEVLTIKDNTTDSSFSVVPGFGFKIHSLIVNGYTIYRPASDVIGSGGQVIMSPWVGRVENGQFDYNGKLQDINELESVKIDPSTGYPKDGLVRNQQWVLEDTGIDEEGAYIKASIDAADHPDILEHFGRSKLTMTIHISGEDIFYDVEVENLDNKKVYNAVGLHEYGISTNRFTTLELNAKSVLDADEKGIPTGGRIALDSPEQEHLNFNDGNIVAAGLVDRTYTDVETDDQGRWQAIVTDAERRIRRTYLVDGEMFQHPHIWSGNTGSYADITSVEFLTDAPNGINNPNSKAWLNVGEKRKGRIALHIETDVKDGAMLGGPWTLKGARKILDNVSNVKDENLVSAINKLAKSGVKPPDDYKRLSNGRKELSRRITALKEDIEKLELQLSKEPQIITEINPQYLYYIEHSDEWMSDVNGLSFKIPDHKISRTNDEIPRLENKIRYMRRKLEILLFKGTDNAQLGDPDVGGIDMNGIEVERTGSGVEIQFVPDSFDPLLKMGIDGFVPVIINVTPVNNIMMLLGLEPKREEDDIELSKAG
ncbi:MAG: hypothetical protein A2306_09465 [Omnitrophica WOR_2 bacterium RIFOXYB2_FULL_38_16]|nr:MAG: hypothetical protein A2306_09465 [Omnitrophica WOR_2 bacterium RIFOXYB2_FULL_38_16]